MTISQTTSVAPGSGSGPVPCRVGIHTGDLRPLSMYTGSRAPEGTRTRRGYRLRLLSSERLKSLCAASAICRSD